MPSDINCVLKVMEIHERGLEALCERGLEESYDYIFAF